MNIGALLIVLALAATATSTVSYFMVTRGYQRFASLARVSYYYFTVLTLGAAFLLLYYFLVGDYSYKYVFEYSSSQLPFFFMIAAFWGGQQGTYLLWMSLLSILGFYLIFRGKEYTNYAMVFYGLINLFFCTMLIILSPFEKLPVPQADGAGLNPLLIDYWMVIHPPVMFIGYASAALPFVIALAALFTNRYKNWLTVVFTPVIIVATALAAGNIMGGFWAYKTLGWGGYWAWDPVENSSLVPWLISLALIHGIIMERPNGAMRKTNLFLSISVFLLVIYGTFLTRSGVLADFSVHSFVDLGQNGFLISFMIGTAILALLLFFARFTSIKGPSIDMSVTSKQFTLIFSIWALCLIAVFVLAGTSWPLITGFFGQAGAVDTEVYTRISFPLAILMGVFMSFAPIVTWKSGSASTVFKKLLLPAILAVVITGISFFFGVTSPSYLAYIFTVSLALAANLISLVKFLPGNMMKAGAQLAHFGFALMLLGILGSSAYATHEKVVINRDDTGNAFGMQLTYQGMANELTTPDNELLLAVQDGGASYEARPKLYWSSRMGGMMKKPFIRRHLFYDMYFSPEQIQDLSEDRGVTLKRDQSVQLGDYFLYFKEFDAQAHSEGAAMRFGAILEVQDAEGNKEQITPAISFEQGVMHHEDASLMAGDADHQVRLETINADDGSIKLTVSGLTADLPQDRLIMEVSKKPTMNFLWAGTILLVLGCLVVLKHRWNFRVSG
ncbi:MAG: cytochrome c biogenesis protein CcsA [Candidatus Zixiibacteriota bacterium]